MLMRFTTSWPGATPGKTSLGVGPLRLRADDQSSPPGAQDAPRQPLQRHATAAVIVCQLVGSPAPGRRASVPGTLQDGVGRGRNLSLGPHPLRSPQSRAGWDRVAAGALAVVQLP